MCVSARARVEATCGSDPPKSRCPARLLCRDKFCDTELIFARSVLVCMWRPHARWSQFAIGARWPDVQFLNHCALMLMTQEQKWFCLFEELCFSKIYIANMRLLCHLDICKICAEIFWMYLVNFLALKKLLACKYLHAKDFWFVSWLLSKFANEPWNLSICHANISRVEMQKLFRCCGCKSNFKLTVSSLKKWSTPNELTIQLFSRRRILLSI